MPRSATHWRAFVAGPAASGSRRGLQARRGAVQLGATVLPRRATPPSRRIRSSSAGQGGVPSHGGVGLCCRYRVGPAVAASPLLPCWQR